MKKKRTEHTEVSYWESMADSMVALLLCIMLVMLLLVLYLVRIPDEQLTDEQLGFSQEQYDDPDDGGGNHSYGRRDDDDGDTYDEGKGRGEGFEGGDGGGGSGYGGDDGENENASQYQDPDPGAGPGEGQDRAAIYVQVVDAETERTIKKAGAEFELYAENGQLQILNVYYPKKIEYKKYLTQDTGTFFLPEKIVPRDYLLRGLTEISGYDLPDDVRFDVDAAYEWDDPFVVIFPYYPSRNSIRIHLTDSSNGKAIAGASFRILAAEDITTLDGTVRHRQGSIVDTVTTDESGYAKSQELYLGQYQIQQTLVPEYFAKVVNDAEVTLGSKKKSGDSPTTNISEDKTGVQVTVADALYGNRGLRNVTFSLVTANGTVQSNYTTDENGQFYAENLKKNVTYRLHQLTSQENYRMPEEDYSFSVSSEGLIDGSALVAVRITNSINRVEIAVQDKIFRGPISDVNVALMDSNGNVIKVWNTTGMAQTVEGLKAGEYQLVIGGNTAAANTFTVTDQDEIQQVSYSRWTPADIAAILGLSIAGVGAIALMIVLMKRNRKKKQEG